MINKFLLKSILIVFPFLLFAVSSYAQSETEPNDLPAQANVLSLNGSISGALNVAGDVDWYKLTTTADGHLFIPFNNTGNGDLKVVSLYDADTTTVLASSPVGDGIGMVERNGLAAGTYFIKVNGNSGTETGNYTLSDSLASPSKANDAEPNDYINEALTLSLNSSTTGHYGYYYNHYMDTTDWYKVTTNEDGNLYLTLDNTGNYAVNLYLYDTTGSPVLSSSLGIGGGVGGLHANGLAAGTYYIKITNAGNNWFGPYTLKDSLAAPSIPNDPESNDNISQAATLPLNDTALG
ncbi:MAG: hypothetical protein ACRDE5_11880, partial [Ginsengibacter sp.]